METFPRAYSCIRVDVVSIIVAIKSLNANGKKAGE